jgi:hypothetical protein
MPSKVDSENDTLEVRHMEITKFCTSTAVFNVGMKMIMRKLLLSELRCNSWRHQKWWGFRFLFPFVDRPRKPSQMKLFQHWTRDVGLRRQHLDVMGVGTSLHFVFYLGCLCIVLCCNDVDLWCFGGLLPDISSIKDEITVILCFDMTQCKDPGNSSQQHKRKLFSVMEDMKFLSAVVPHIVSIFICTASTRSPCTKVSYVPH